MSSSTQLKRKVLNKCTRIDQSSLLHKLETTILNLSAVNVILILKLLPKRPRRKEVGRLVSNSYPRGS